MRARERHSTGLQEIPQHPRAGLARFFRMELHAAADCAARSPPRTENRDRRPRPFRRRRDGRRVGVREIKVGVSGNAAQQSARSPSRSHLIPADVRRFHVGRQRANFSGKKPSPSSPGASSLDANIACSPRQIPRIGTPESNRGSQRFRQTSLAKPATNAEKWPTPGSTIASARRDLLAAAIARSVSAPSPLQRALDRGQISGAVIDDRDLHSSPFVDGSTRRSCLSRVTAKRSAFAKALKMDST